MGLHGLLQGYLYFICIILIRHITKEELEVQCMRDEGSRKVFVGELVKYRLLRKLGVTTTIISG
jgi:hypothetical protein